MSHSAYIYIIYTPIFPYQLEKDSI